LTRLNSAEFAPMPSASVATTAYAKPGARLVRRKAWRRSCHKLSAMDVCFESIRPDRRR
jgi:hypothetical protein